MTYDWGTLCRILIRVGWDDVTRIRLGDGRRTPGVGSTWNESNDVSRCFTSEIDGNA